MCLTLPLGWQARDWGASAAVYNDTGRYVGMIVPDPDIESDAVRFKSRSAADLSPADGVALEQVRQSASPEAGPIRMH